MEFFFLLLIIPIILSGYRWVYKPFADRTIEIDHLKYPMLARTQRILYYSNVTARQKELKAREVNHQNELVQIESAIEKEGFNRLNESQAQHMELIESFDKLYHEYDTPGREAKAKELAEKKRAELDEYEKRRARELEMWTANEKIRIAKFQKEQQEQALRDREELNLKKARLEDHYASLQTAEGWKALASAGGLRAPVETSYDIFAESSYGDRVVAVHGVYVRGKASKQGKILNNLAQYEKISVDGWTVGEELYGNPIWFHQKPSGLNLAGWIWSGGLNNQSTSGIPRMSDEIKLSNNPNDSLDRLAELSNSEVDALQLKIRAEFNSIGQTGEPTRYDVDRMSELADINDRITAERSRRADLAANEVTIFKTRAKFTENSEMALDMLTEMYKTPEKYLNAQEVAALESEVAILDKKVNPKVKLGATINTGMITADHLTVSSGGWSVHKSYQH